MCLPVNQKHPLSLISTVVSKLKDFSRSQAVTYTVKVIIAEKLCKTDRLFNKDH